MKEIFCDNNSGNLSFGRIVGAVIVSVGLAILIHGWLESRTVPNIEWLITAGLGGYVGNKLGDFAPKPEGEVEP